MAYFDPYIRRAFYAFRELVFIGAP